MLKYETLEFAEPITEVRSLIRQLTATSSALLNVLKPAKNKKLESRLDEIRRAAFQNLSRDDGESTTRLAHSDWSDALMEVLRFQYPSPLDHSQSSDGRPTIRRWSLRTRSRSRSPSDGGEGGSSTGDSLFQSTFGLRPACLTHRPLDQCRLQTREERDEEIASFTWTLRRLTNLPEDPEEETRTKAFIQRALHRYFYSVHDPRWAADEKGNITHPQAVTRNFEALFAARQAAVNAVTAGCHAGAAMDMLEEFYSEFEPKWIEIQGKMQLLQSSSAEYDVAGASTQTVGEDGQVSIVYNLGEH